MTSTQSVLTRLDRIVSDLEGTDFHARARAATRATLATHGEKHAIKHAKRIRDRYRDAQAHIESLAAEEDAA